MLGGLLPAWSPALAKQFPDIAQLQSEKDYREWLLYLVGIWGDPVAAKKMSEHAKATGIKLKKNPYTYRPAFKNSIDEAIGPHSPSSAGSDLGRPAAGSGCYCWRWVNPVDLTPARTADLRQ